MVVTGAAGGLGRALCLRFGAGGASIAALDRDAGALAALSGLLAGRGIRHAAVACDVADEGGVAAAFDQARAILGPVDLLIANAGITQRSLLANTLPAVIRRVMEVNFLGALYCTHEALPDLLARRGMVIGISSVAGFAPLLARTGYAASKHALHGFFDSLRSEVSGAGVDVLLVCPSFIETGIEKAALAGDGRPVGHGQAVVGRRATPEEIAEKIHRAAVRRRRLLLPGAVPRLAWWVSRLAPGVYARLMARSQRAELEAG
ncbi:MAG: SDR family oxidoreductase [Rhodocyclaceae bacterium]|nr:SDR family oxidoreductase [Rhodocyclaceae bacterium]